MRAQCEATFHNLRCWLEERHEGNHRVVKDQQYTEWSNDDARYFSTRPVGAAAHRGARGAKESE